MNPPPPIDFQMAATGAPPFPEAPAADAAAFYEYGDGVEGSSVEQTESKPYMMEAVNSGSASNSAWPSAPPAALASSFALAGESPPPPMQGLGGFGSGDNDNGSSRSIMSSSSSMVPGSPLPAERLARKQRNFPRRGGFVHSALLKSAVMACMSESDRKNTNALSPNTAGGDLTVSDFLALTSNNNLGNNLGGSSSSSPRKRMRRSDHATVSVSANPMLGGGSSASLGSHHHHHHHKRGLGNNNNSNHGNSGNPNHNSSSNPTDEAVIARATDLLQRLCVKPLDHSDGPASRHSRHSRRAAPVLQVEEDDVDEFERKAPVRRVSRRTSYQSQISTGTTGADYDDLDDDEFH